MYTVSELIEMDPFSLHQEEKTKILSQIVNHQISSYSNPVLTKFYRSFNFNPNEIFL
jgi:hypothetical protein